MSLPYYISWSKQNGATTFPILRVDGARIYTTNDRPVIDMSSISYQAHFGHNHPLIIKKIKEQLDSIPMSSPKGVTPNKNETTEKLLQYMDRADGKIFYTTGGAETIENALKFARDISGKKIILARQNSYHGATLGALSVTGDWRNPLHLTTTDWVVRIPEPDSKNAVDLTRQIILATGSENIAGLILETITGGNGVIIPSEEWYNGIQSLCDEFNIILILDEVVCGFHRTGKSFAYQHYKNLKPDMVTLAKGITGGMIPFGALWTSKKIAKVYEDKLLCCGLTNYAHPLGIAAMSAVLEILTTKSFQDNLAIIEKLFLSELEKLKSLPIVKNIRVSGMLCAIDLHKTVEWKNFFEKGIYLVSQTNRLILAPPLIMDQATLLEAMTKISQVLKEAE
jgi:taurine--2-oxoglutarate transaminase